MKNLSFNICLVIAALFGSVGSVFGQTCYSNPSGCNNTAVLCNYATKLNRTKWETNTRWVGHVREAKRRGLTCGFKTVKPSLIRSAFIKLSKENRKQLQTNLKDLGFYKSSIDGLYGKGTAGALTAYNRQNLNGADLKKSENVEKLYSEALALKPEPKIEPVPVAKTPVQKDETYKVASGSGFYVSDAGHIITNHHVIEGCEDMKVHSKGNVLETIQITPTMKLKMAA